MCCGAAWGRVQEEYVALLFRANLISFAAFPLPRGRSGGMIVDPLRSGFPQPGIDPSTGLPGGLPPGAVPPGARFDPFGPLGAGRAGYVFGHAWAATAAKFHSMLLLCPHSAAPPGVVLLLLV